MAKKKISLPGKARKGQFGNKAQNKSLMDATKTTSLKGSKVRLRTINVHLPPPPVAKSQQSMNAVGHRHPKQITPGSAPLVLELRHIERETPLVKLPIEPTPCRATPFTPKGHFKFLELAPEIRNLIYEYTIPAEYYAIDWVKGTQKSRSLTYRIPNKSKAFAPRLHEDVLSRRKSVNEWHSPERRALLEELFDQHSPVSLLLVCQKMYPEAASMFYAKSIFGFKNLRVLRKFLNQLRTSSIESITHLSLGYTTYGHPTKTDNQIWKSKHDNLWSSLCWRVSDDCTSLTHLALDLSINTTPFAFTSFEKAESGGLAYRWVKPLWAFQDKNLKRCWCRLRSWSKLDTVLEVESWKVRKEILGEQWNEETEAERNAYGCDKKASAKKGMVFRIVDGGDLVGVA